MPQHPDATAKATPMPGGFSALLVYDQDEPVCGLERIFLSNGIRLRRSRNCSEARTVLSGPVGPNLVVTDLTLPDGDWSDILQAATATPTKTPVIVVSRFLDIRLYLDVLDRGAHDFVVPPVSSADLAYIIRAAIRTEQGFAPRCQRHVGPGEKLSKYPDMEASSLRNIDPMPRNTERIK